MSKMTSKRGAVEYKPELVPCIGYNHFNMDYVLESSRELNAFRLQNTLCDFVIKVGAKKYYCHKVILASAAPYFKSLIFSSYKEGVDGEVEFPTNMWVPFDVIIDFIYLGSIKITPANIIGIMEFGNYFEMDSLKEACGVACAKGLLRADNVINILCTARLLDMDPVIESCTNYINENIIGISKTKEFLAIDIGLLLDFIRHEEQQTSEQYIWEAVIKWVKHDPDNRKEFMCKILPHIRFHLINPTYLSRNIAGEELLNSAPDCKNYIFDVLRNRMTENDLKGTNPSQTRFHKGDICVLGGRNSGGDVLSDLLLYDTDMNKWYDSANTMPTPIKFFAAVFLKRNMYTVGGLTKDQSTDTVQRYVVHNGTWGKVHPMTYPRFKLAACAMYNHMYACGGQNPGNATLNVVECYDPLYDSWVTVSPMIEARKSLAVVQAMGCIWATGGQNDNIFFSSVERYDPREGQWEQFATMPTPRFAHGAAALDDKIYICGGMTTQSILNTFDEFDPRNKFWRPLAPTKYHRSSFPLLLYRRMLWAVCGDSRNTVEIYDARKNEWTEGTPLGTSVVGHSAVIIPRTHKYL